MRVIKGATVPVFVVREDRSLERWLAGRSPLRVMIGVDPHKRAHAPLDWLTDWKRVGKLELAAAHVYAPGEERLRQVAAQREVELTAEVSSVLEPHSHLGSARVRLLGGFGRVAEHLLDLANAENADLLVVGTHRRTGWTRWVHGSVSLDIVAVARRNCVAVPILPPAAPATAPSTIRRVLVPVDFSDTTPRAVAWAMQLVPDGGTLQLVHVVAPFVAAATEFGTYVPLPAPTPEEQARERSETERKLRELVPDSARARSLSVEAHVLDGFDPATQIAAAARRLGSDVICLSTHGRSGLSRALLGSVAQGVVKRSSVPVFIVPPGERNRP
jgi:nucleotide-binding universal stress UspA family protein